MIVDSIMTRSVVTVLAEASARDAARLMASRGIGGLVVLQGGEPVGILTERDLTQRVLAAGANPDTTRVRDIMSKPLATVEPAASVQSAAETMKRLKVKRLVVVLGSELRGIVTVTDVANAFPDVAKQYFDAWVKPNFGD